LLTPFFFHSYTATFQQLFWIAIQNLPSVVVQVIVVFLVILSLIISVFNHLAKPTFAPTGTARPTTEAPNATVVVEQAVSSSTGNSFPVIPVAVGAGVGLCCLLIIVLLICLLIRRRDGHRERDRRSAPEVRAMNRRRNEKSTFIFLGSFQTQVELSSTQDAPSQYQALGSVSKLANSYNELPMGQGSMNRMSQM
jgi:hypothetical protein